MAKRATAPKRGTTVNQQPVHICDDCKHSNWVQSHSNLDWEGKPICLTCPFEQWYILRGRKACGKWEPEPKGKEGNQ